MQKEELIDLVKEYGEAIITYRSQNSNKVKYNVCTLDFDNPHIDSKASRASETEDTVLMFCWDCDSYRLMRSTNVTSVVPLSSFLKEKDEQ